MGSLTETGSRGSKLDADPPPHGVKLARRNTNTMGSVVQLIKAFGGKVAFEKAVHEMQDALYQETA